MGAGVIPFSVLDGEVYFLFQMTFTGRKVGCYIDFGGGLGKTEDYQDAAIREFVEETETMYFSDAIRLARRTDESVKKQVPLVKSLFEKTLLKHPEWYCRRASPNPSRPKDWISFFVEFPYRDISELNNEWKNDHTGRFKKRRELIWISADELLSIYEFMPEKLWKRVRQLEGVIETIHSIKLEKVDV